MEKQIQQQLDAIEQQYGISILLACETGSRAWGFPSPDSDYDVRFMYMHPLEWYLSIDEQKDTIEYMEGELDLVGWDIRKCLRLFHKSNAAMFERIQSPIIYRKRNLFAEELLASAPDYFSARAGLHHYMSMAFKYYNACAGKKKMKLKSYFYMLRTALASLWIVEKRSIPPLAFQELLPLVAEKELRDKIIGLVSLKAKVAESYLHPKDVKIEAFVEKVLLYCKSTAGELEKHKGPAGALKKLFINTIGLNVTQYR